MLFANKNALQLREQMDDWRAATITTLSSEAMRQMLQPERADRLRDYAERAGILALKEQNGTVKVDRPSSQRSRNGVYFVPMPPQCGYKNIRIPYEKPKPTLKMPGLNPLTEGGARHSAWKHLPYMNFIIMPTEQAAKSQAEHVALFTHELVHVDQTKRNSWDSWFEREAPEKVVGEAEAYNVQFKILDTYLDGALEKACAKTLALGNVTEQSKTLVIPNDIVLPEGRSRLNLTEQWTLIHEAYNRVTNYTPDGISPPPQELVDMYAQGRSLSSS